MAKEVIFNLKQEHGVFVQRKVAAARTSVRTGRGRSNDDVEAEFAARRARLQNHEWIWPPIRK